MIDRIAPLLQFFLHRQCFPIAEKTTENAVFFNHKRRSV
nr:MAG TPA: hypothetical protein [Caudoviricetes sp.]